MRHSRTHSRFVGLTAATVFLALGASVAAPAARAAGPKEAVPIAGGTERPAPGRNVKLQDALSEQMLSLGDFEGRYVVIHFGTSW